MINDIATKCLNINNFIPRKLIERCGTEGIAIDEVIFLVSLEPKHFYKLSMLYMKSSYAISRFQSAIYFIKKRFSLCISKGRSSL